MEKQKGNKGLIDDNEGEFILNESGTSVSIDAEGEYSEDKAIADSNAEVEEKMDQNQRKAEQK